MIERVELGMTGHELQTYLPGTDLLLLPDASTLIAPPRVDALLSSDVLAPTGNGTQTLLDGRVTATTTGYGSNNEMTAFDVVGPWNSVKNGTVATDEAANLSFSGFVHVDAIVGIDASEGSNLELTGVKRGNIVVGNGDDHVSVQIATNGTSWSNEFRVNAGAGNDVVTFSTLDVSAARTQDPTFAHIDGLQLINDYNGSDTTLHISLGAGSDAAKGAGGNDIIDGGTGSNFLSGGDGTDTFALDTSNGEVVWDTITDWQAGDHLSLKGWQTGVSQASWVESAGTASYEGATMHVDLNNDGTIDTSITWTGLMQDQIPAPMVIEAEGTLWFG
jgi:Ca2+-binding RTX toxin-like protein